MNNKGTKRVLAKRAEKTEGKAARLCQAVTKSGRPCGSLALKGSRFCTFHDPKHSAAVAQGRKIGGAVTKYWNPEDDLPDVRNLEDCLGLLNKIKNMIYKGRLPGPLASALKSITDSLSNVLKIMAERDLKAREVSPPRPPEFDEEELKKILASPEGRYAIEVLCAIENGEPIPAFKRIPLPQNGREKKTARYTPEIKDRGGLPNEDEDRPAEGKYESQEQNIEETAEDSPLKEGEREKKPTIAFVDSERFWEMLEGEGQEYEY